MSYCEGQRMVQNDPWVQGSHYLGVTETPRNNFLAASHSCCMHTLRGAAEELPTQAPSKCV